VHPHWIIEALATTLTPNTEQALQRQLYCAVRGWIHTGKLTAHSKLPASRALASALGIARNTVLAAYDQLQAEGYLEAKHGSGTFISALHPSPPETPVQRSTPELSARGCTLLQESKLPQGLSGAFVPGLPAIDAFPLQLWHRLQTRHTRKPDPSWLHYQHGGGLPQLKRAICTYLQMARQVRCHPDQILITQGVQQGLELLTRLLANPGDNVWLEDPGYIGVQAAMRASGLNIVPVPLDDQGLNPHAAPAGVKPKLIYVTPSHQYPVGIVMSMARRMELLALAETHDAWIIEDDYDSEFRYNSKPLASLQGQAHNQRVLYLGTFSKVMYPDLRLAYMVVPEPLIDAFRAVNARLYREGHYVQQAALADFIEQGHLARHIKRMRALYLSRQQLLRSTLSDHLGNTDFLTGGEAGMHMIATLPDDADEEALRTHGAREHIWLRTLSGHFSGPVTRKGLVLGYAGVTESEICSAASKLAHWLDPLLGHAS
jgi:GntR family transcriptional regulator/MocR family aminotransferase